jgi:hypothetical protein
MKKCDIDIRIADIGKCHMRTLAGQTFDNGENIIPAKRISGFLSQQRIPFPPICLDAMRP